MEQLEALPIAPSQFDESALLSPRRDEPKAIEYPTSETEPITTNGANCITPHVPSFACAIAACVLLKQSN